MTEGTVSQRSRPTRFRLAALAGVAVSLAFLTGRDGSPGWQALRVIVVALGAAAAGAAVSRLGRRWRGGALLLFGIAGAAAGAGIAVAWVPKAGLTLTTAAGVVALAAGLVSLAFGLVDLGGPRRGWLGWGVVAALALASAVVVLSLAIAVAATNVPPTALGSETPADRGLSFEAVEFPAADGVGLSGWYVPSHNGAAVVLLPGSGSTRSAVLDHAVVLAGGGYGVLLFDARGHGESGGRAMDFGWFGDADIGGALDYLMQRPDVTSGRLALVGLSMGGEEAIGAAAGDRRVQGVVAEGATGRTAADKAWLAEEYGFRGLIQQGVDRLTYWLADLMTSADPPISLHDAVVQMAPRPVLLITAGEVPDESLAAYFLAAATPATVTVEEIPGAGHTGGLATAPEVWTARVLAFLDSLLLPPAAG